MPSNKVKSGDPLDVSADVYNYAVEQYWRSRGGVSARTRGDRPNYSAILVRNDTGQDIDRFGPVALFQPLVMPQTDLDAFQSQVAMSIIGSPSTSQPYTWAIMQEPVAAGELGLALMSGVTQVIIDIPTSGAQVQFAGPNGTRVSLQRVNCGICRVLWMNNQPTSPGSGKAWALVNIG